MVYIIYLCIFRVKTEKIIFIKMEIFQRAVPFEPIAGARVIDTRTPHFTVIEYGRRPRGRVRHVPGHGWGI